MNDQVELRQFIRARVIAELRSVSRASEKLHVSQPALTTDMKKFQEALRVRLFLILSGNRMRLTRAGRALPVLVQQIENTIENSIKVLVALQNDEVSVLRFGCGSFVDLDLFQSACGLYLEAFPDSEIAPTEADAATLMTQIVAGELDAAIVTKPVNDHRLSVEEIRRDRMVVCLRADNPLAAKSRIAPMDLEKKQLILYHPGQHPDAYAKLMELLQDAGIKMRLSSRASSPHNMQMLVRGGYGFALVREGAVRDPELTTRPIAGLDWTVDTALVYDEQRYPKTIDILLPLLQTRFGAESREKQLLERVQAAMPAPAFPPDSQGAKRETPIQLFLFAGMEKSSRREVRLPAA